ncbi:MAG: acyltransferase [Candidatus Amulumruptor caecigallinarius]|nr:acyltransferase [Candidatus Amulumruptor caecigallinarius]MCM1396661.1 acyltransferase [Candidatus Amulumruptor caecigallinarius]MCM1453281.1 acyltransferase [bacterium]
MTMLLVVIAHVEQMLMWWGISSFTFSTSDYRMPLFFFISGVVTFSSRITLANPESIRAAVWKKLIMALWPTVVIFLIFSLWFMQVASLNQTLLSEMKGGYWFTYVLVQVYILSIPLMCVLNSERIPRYMGIASVAVLIILIAAYGKEVTEAVFPPTLTGYLSFSRVVYYLPFFMLGMLSRLALPHITAFMDRRRFAAILIVAASSTAGVMLSGGESGVLADFIGRSMVVGSVFCICYLLKGILCTGNIGGRMLSMIGRHTLPIYLLHYFILFGLNKLIFHFLPGQMLPTEICVLPMAVVVAIGVSGACLIIYRLLKIIGIRQYIFPTVHSPVPQKSIFKWVRG